MSDRGAGSGKQSVFTRVFLLRCCSSLIDNDRAQRQPRAEKVDTPVRMRPCPSRAPLRGMSDIHPYVLPVSQRRAKSGTRSLPLRHPAVHPAGLNMTRIAHRPPQTLEDLSPEPRRRSSNCAVVRVHGGMSWRPGEDHGLHEGPTTVPRSRTLSPPVRCWLVLHCRRRALRAAIVYVVVPLRLRGGLPPAPHRWHRP